MAQNNKALLLDCSETLDIFRVDIQNQKINSGTKMFDAQRGFELNDLQGLKFERKVAEFVTSHRNATFSQLNTHLECHSEYIQSILN